MPGDGDKPAVRLVRGGVMCGSRLLPLYAGSVHYWRLRRGDWRACLQAVADLGLRFVDTYVPWGVHEQRGELDFGQHDPRLDLAAFLRLADELGLAAILRPGPHINAELTYFGLPERIVWDAACQARGPRGDPVVLPAPPKMFPVPSYASEAFRDEVAHYFGALGPVLAPLCQPAGPIAMLQIDNEGALYFRDGVFDQDYHPDAVAGYRAFVRRKYGSIEALREAYGSVPADDAAEHAVAAVDHAAPLRFADLEPPRRFAARRRAELTRLLDWAEYQEQLVPDALERFAADLGAAGLGGVPTFHNLPPEHQLTPLDPARVGQVVELVGCDLYHAAGSRTRHSISRRVSELGVRAEAAGQPPFACELGAGYACYFPPLDEASSTFTWMCALAYGLRAFNLYMAVGRDRWVGAPIDRRGAPRAYAERVRELLRALDGVALHALRRPVPVRLVVPRAERRLGRVLHAAGPLSPALLSMSAMGPRETCLEPGLGEGPPLAVAADGWMRCFERALERRGVPFAWVEGAEIDGWLDGARWIVCGTSGLVSDALLERLQAAVRAGAKLTVGPAELRHDEALRPRTTPALAQLAIEQLDLSDEEHIDALVERRVAALELPSYRCEPHRALATVHCDAGGQPRVAYLINATAEPLQVRAWLGDTRCWRDVSSQERFEVRGDAICAHLPARTVRMLAAEAPSAP